MSQTLEKIIRPQNKEKTTWKQRTFETRHSPTKSLQSTFKKQSRTYLQGDVFSKRDVAADSQVVEFEHVWNVRESSEKLVHLER